MSYKRGLKWMKKHLKRSKQNVIFHTGGSFTPSHSFIEQYFKYREQCEKEGKEPLDCEGY